MFCVSGKLRKFHGIKYYQTKVYYKKHFIIALYSTFFVILQNLGINWAFPLFSCYYSLNTTTVMSWNNQKSLGDYKIYYPFLFLVVTLITTVPLTLILIINVILYFLTWQRIKKEEPKFKGIDGREAKRVRASHRAARTMSLFVTAFFIQWWAMSVYGIVQVSSQIEVPIELFQFVTTFSNVGGILNGIVYVIIRRRLPRKTFRGQYRAIEIR